MKIESKNCKSLKKKLRSDEFTYIYTPILKKWNILHHNRSNKVQPEAMTRNMKTLSKLLFCTILTFSLTAAGYACGDKASSDSKQVAKAEDKASCSLSKKEVTQVAKADDKASCSLSKKEVTKVAKADDKASCSLSKKEVTQVAKADDKASCSLSKKESVEVAKAETKPAKKDGAGGCCALNAKQVQVAQAE